MNKKSECACVRVLQLGPEIEGVQGGRAPIAPADLGRDTPQHAFQDGFLSFQLEKREV